MNIQLKNVPEEVHAELRRRAAQRGVSMRDYVLALIRRDQRLPAPDEWRSRVADLEPVEVSIDPVEVIRAARGARDDELASRTGSPRR